jgi:hypothetical protein
MKSIKNFIIVLASIVLTTTVAMPSSAMAHSRSEDSETLIIQRPSIQRILIVQRTNILQKRMKRVILVIITKLKNMTTTEKISLIKMMTMIHLTMITTITNTALLQ